jgi:nucleoside-diphosphate-sugar epimerase
MKRFVDQVVVITGAANGIGKACAQRFAQEGANIACLDITTADNEATAAECRSLGVEALALLCDVTDVDNIRLVIDAIRCISRHLHWNPPRGSPPTAMAAHDRHQPYRCFSHQPGDCADYNEATPRQYHQSFFYGGQNKLARFG